MAGAVRVRPIGLYSLPTLNWYQYQRPGSQSLHFHVHRVAERRQRQHRAAATIRHLLVGGDAPLDGHRPIRHAAALERLQRQPRPQHDPIRRGIARRDSQRERVVAEALGRRRTRTPAAGNGG